MHQHAVTVLVQHWDPNKYLLAGKFADELPTIVEEDKLELLRRVARRMQTAPKGLAGNYIPGADLVEEFEDYLHTELEVPRHQARPGAEQMLEQFRHRNFILSRFGAGVYGFVHRAFLEYLAADDVRRRFADRKLTEDDLLELFGTRWKDPAWHEVLRHVTGMLPEEFARSTIEHLLTLNPDWRRRRPALPHHVVLALQCLSEVRRPGALAATSRAVMTAITDTLLVASQRRQGYDLDQLLENTLPAALAAFGPHWAGREVYRSWFAEHHRSLSLQASYSNGRPLILATRIAVLLAGDDAALRSALLEQAESGRTPAVRTAAINGFISGDDMIPEADALLRKLAADDRDAEVRAAALTGLKERLTPADAEWVRNMPSEGAWSEVVDAAVAVVAEKWPEDERTLPWLRDLLNREVGGGAVAETLASRWSPDLAVLTWLRDLVETSLSERPEIITAVGAGWAHEPGVRDWLVGLAENGTRMTRDAAVTAIGSAWRGEHRTVRWLRERIPVEPDGYVRWSAIRALGEAEPSAETEADLRHWAISDPHYFARRQAIKALAKHAMSPDLCDWLAAALTTEPDGYVRTTLITLLAEADVPGDWARSTALTDPDASVRLTAAEAVIAQSEDPGLLDWLIGFVRTEPSRYSCKGIVQKIVEGWPDRTETQSWLRGTGDDLLDESVATDGLAIRWMHEPWFAERLHALAAPGTALSPRTDALNYLGTLWPADCKDLFLGLVEADPNPFVREAALSQLIRHLGDTPAELEWLRDRLAEDGASVVQTEAFEAILDRGRTSAAARTWVETAIVSGSLDNLLEQLVFHLAYLGFAQDQFKALLVDLAEHHPADRVREAAVVPATRRLGPAATTQWLRERFDHESSPLVRSELVRLLGTATEALEVRDWLRGIAKSAEPEVVRVAALTHSAATLAELQAAYPGTSDKSAQYAILRAVTERWRFGDGIREWFVTMAERAPLPEGRATALARYASAWQMHPGVLDWLWDRLDDPSPVVRCAAVEAIDDWRHLPETTARLRALADPDFTVRLTLLQTCQQARRTAGTVRWARGYAESDPDPAVRAAALVATAEVWQGDPAAVDWFVRRVAEDNDWEPRSQAVLLAMMLGNHRPRILAWIRDLALHDDDALVRSAAVEAWALGWATRAGERADLTRVGTEDPRTDVRVAVVRALGGVRPGDDAVSVWLNERAQDSDPAVARVAARLLGDRVPVPEIPGAAAS